MNTNLLLLIVFYYFCGMKISAFFLFILLANTTFRCAEEENTINCNDASNDMIGRWEGTSSYTQPSSASGVMQKFAIDIVTTDGCLFYGISSFEDSNTTFSVTGTIDKYGWVVFRETEFANDGGEYTGCTSNGSSWNNPCNRWPYIRYKPGNKFEDARFRANPYILNGTFRMQGGWSGSVGGNYILTKI